MINLKFKQVTIIIFYKAVTEININTPDFSNKLNVFNISGNNTIQLPGSNLPDQFPYFTKSDDVTLIQLTKLSASMVIQINNSVMDYAEYKDKLKLLLEQFLDLLNIETNNFKKTTIIVDYKDIREQNTTNDSLIDTLAAKFVYLKENYTDFMAFFTQIVSKPTLGINTYLDITNIRSSKTYPEGESFKDLIEVEKERSIEKETLSRVDIIDNFNDLTDQLTREQVTNLIS